MPNIDTNSAVTIDARTLDAQSSFSYNGEEGEFFTDDRFIMSDANVNNLARVDGGFVSFNSGRANEDILEVRNSAVITIDDLSGFKNIAALIFTNDQAVTQTAVLQLDNATVEALVDSSHTAVAGQVETLTINAFDNPLISGAFTNAAAVEAAIINGGGRELTFDDDFDKGESFLVVYDDGADTHVAPVTATDTTANDAKIADATTIDTADLVTVTGVSGATLLTNAQFLNLLG